MGTEIKFYDVEPPSSPNKRFNRCLTKKWAISSFEPEKEE